LFFVDLFIEDHGSLVIFRSASVRPRPPFDQNLDHDYFFKLPFSGSGKPITWAVFYFPQCPVPSCPVFAGQAVGIKEVHDDIWFLSFMDYDLGYFDLETRVLEPPENPFGPKVLSMS